MPDVSPIDMFGNALTMLGVMGAAQSAPNAEDAELCRRTYNRMVGQWNTRRRNSSFMREEAFTFTTARTSYMIGASTNTPAPNFTVSRGNAPATIYAAQLIMTNVTPNVQLELVVINVDQWQDISIPTLASQFPNTLYYVRPGGGTLNGTLRPWPTSPTQTSFQLGLTWWDQLLQVAATDLITAISLPDGYEEALTLTLAEKLWLAFPKRTDLEELKRQARLARADMQSPNSQPPKIDTTGGAQGRPSGFNWLTRLPG